MTRKQQRKIKREIIIILREWVWGSKRSTHSELADFIIMAIKDSYENK